MQSYKSRKWLSLALARQHTLETIARFYKAGASCSAQEVFFKAVAIYLVVIASFEASAPLHHCDNAAG